jgi:predicted dehydrogenase
MTTDKTSRRDFLKVAGAGLASTALASTATSYARIVGANDRVGVGIVGFSDRFRGSLMPSFHKHSDEMNFEFVGVSDLWSMRRDQAQAAVQKLTGKQIFAARNNEELYTHKEVDAVFVATADFQHAYHGTEAVQAGRDAYVEKPTAHTMADARKFHKAVHDSAQIVAVGTQRRSSPIYQRACDFVQSGKFGDIVCVEMTWNVNQPGRWRRPSVVPLLKQEDTDWKRYLNASYNPDRPIEAFDPRKYLEFRLFWPYSSGIPDQWLVHQIDTVHWFTGLPRPRSVVANGGIYLWKDGRTNWDTMTAVFDYGPLNDSTKGFQVIYSSRMTNSAGDVKEIYRSNGGTLDLVKNEITPEGGLTERAAKEMNMQPNLLPTVSLTQQTGDAATSADTGADDTTVANVRNWMECVRSRKTPNASIDAGYSHSIALCMNVAAIQTGKRVTFDDAKQEVVIGA